MGADQIVLIIDDDPAVCRTVARSLAETEFKVIEASTGRQGQKVISEQRVALAIVDLNLPDMDGLTIIRELNERSDVGTLILSGRAEATERIIGLEIGADDYLTKPFEPRELLARVRSIMRRVGRQSKDVLPSYRIYRFDRWRVDTNIQVLTSSDGQEIRLSYRQFAMLMVFIENRGQTLSRGQLLDRLYENDAPVYDRAIDVGIRRLREAIETDPRKPNLIITARNLGYRFTPEVRGEQ